MEDLEDRLKVVYAKIDKGRDKIQQEAMIPLHSKSDPQSVELLREQMSIAEQQGYYISEWRRALAELAPAYKSYKLSVIKDDEGYAKLNAAEKTIRLEAETAVLDSYAEYLDRTEELIKRRCSLGQTFLKSINNELSGKVVPMGGSYK